MTSAPLRFFNLCHSKENRLYPFVSLLFSFVSQRVRKYSVFQFLRDLYIANLANFQDIEIGPTAKEKVKQFFFECCWSHIFKNFFKWPTSPLGAFSKF